MRSTIITLFTVLVLGNIIEINANFAYTYPAPYAVPAPYQTSTYGGGFLDSLGSETGIFGK